MSDLAFVVLLDGKQTAGCYLEGRTCLNHLARLARIVGRDVHIALFCGHTDAKWKGRGLR